MNFVLNFILIIIASIFQSTVLSFFSLHLGIANLILIIFLVFLFLRYYKISLLWAGFGGFLLDIFSGGKPAGYLFAFLIIYFLLRLFFKAFEIREFLALLVIVFVASLFLDLFHLVFLTLTGVKISIFGFSKLILFDGFLNILLVCLVYPIIIYIDRNWFSKKQKILTLE